MTVAEIQAIIYAEIVKQKDSDDYDAPYVDNRDDATPPNEVMIDGVIKLEAIAEAVHESLRHDE